MLKEISEIIHSFIRRNRYRKAIYFCELCGRPIMKNEVYIFMGWKQKILCSHCDFNKAYNHIKEKEYLKA